MNVLSLFDGISCGMVALERAGIKVDKYFSSEIDKYAMKVSEKNYPDIIQIWSAENVSASNLPKIDLLIGGSPCTTLSIAGDGTGFEGESGLFWEYARIKKEANPDFFLFENVKMKKEWMNVITNELGVEPHIINSSLLSAQHREREHIGQI
jgi:DNA-cytosine methyltransferase